MATSSSLCSKAIRMATWQQGVILYNNTPGYNVGTWYPSLNAYQMDCLGFVRAVLCGWTGSKTAIAGGTNYSYPCAGYTTDAFLNSCSSRSSNFSTLYQHPLSLLQIPNNSHVGIYVGNFTFQGHTFNSCECTPNGVMIQQGATPSWCDTDGTRRAYKDGPIAGRWTNWGIFSTDGTHYPAIDYDGTGGGGVGASPYAIAAVCGSWWGESRLSPGIWESMIPMSWDYIYSQSDPNKGGYGLAMWTNLAPSAMGLLDMHNWLVEHGYADDSGEGETAYFVEEGWWLQKSGNYGNYASLSDFLQTSETNLTYLVHDFLNSYQGAQQWQIDAVLAQRSQWARDVYDYIREHQNDNPEDYQWASGNRVLSDEEAFGNALLIYWQLAEGTYVEPSPSNPGEIPPKAWFYLRSNAIYNNQRKILRKGKFKHGIK